MPWKSIFNWLQQKHKFLLITSLSCCSFLFSAAKQNGHEAKEKKDNTVTRSDQSKSPQNNTISSPEDSVIQPLLHTDHISNNSENNHDFTVSIEPDPTAALDTSDSDPEKEANLSLTEIVAVEMNPPDADLDHQSSSDASSSAAEANNKSFMSENHPQEIIVSETHDTKPIIDEQPEEDNHPSPAERQGLFPYRSLHAQLMTKNSALSFLLLVFSSLTSSASSSELTIKKT